MSYADGVGHPDDPGHVRARVQFRICCPGPVLLDLLDSAGYGYAFAPILNIDPTINGCHPQIGPRRRRPCYR